MLLSSGAYRGSASGTGRHRSSDECRGEPGWARIKPPSPDWINTCRYGVVTQVCILMYDLLVRSGLCEQTTRQGFSRPASSGQASAFIIALALVRNGGSANVFDTGAVRAGLEVGVSIHKRNNVTGPIARKSSWITARVQNTQLSLT